MILVKFVSFSDIGPPLICASLMVGSVTYRRKHRVVQQTLSRLLAWSHRASVEPNGSPKDAEEHDKHIGFDVIDLTRNRPGTMVRLSEAAGR